MRAVVDTNVFISAALRADSIPALAVAIVLRYGTLLKSGATERQLFEVLARPYFTSLVAATTLARFADIFSAAEAVTIVEGIAACRDPTDDKFLELAVNGHADLIVSGDADLLVLDPYRDIPIMTPAAFLRDLTRFIGQ